MNYSVIIAAGGLSTRFGSNKLLAKLNNKKILLYQTIELFFNDPDCQQIIIGCYPELVSLVQQWFNSSPKIQYADFGLTRFLTINNCFKIPIVSETVMIHDGARCYLTEKNLTAMKTTFFNNKSMALIPILPVVDTIKEINQDKLVTLNRQYLYQVQTPQVFKTKLIKEAYKLHFQKKKNKIIYDDSQLIEQYFPLVKINQMSGWDSNYKVTYYHDTFK